MIETQGPDKWQLLADLTEAAEDFDLSHRTLSVLKALLTFVPTRHIPSGTVVFPANRTLAHRLSGMPESTLRRHLARLVQAGIVSRQDSPNRKRYARHLKAGIAVAFGFDLTPLVEMSAELSTRATAAKERRAALAIMREQVMSLRALSIAQIGEDALSDEVALLLRRKPVEHDLKDAMRRLTKALETAETSAADDQNERHIQNDFQYSNSPTPVRLRTNLKVFDLRKIIARCTSFALYFPDAIRNWRDLIQTSEKLAPMIGLERAGVHEAQNVMGTKAATVAILCILEKVDQIKSPAAYLNHLIKAAKQDKYVVWQLFEGLRSQELSADNRYFLGITEP